MNVIQLIVGVCLIVLAFWANNNYTVPGILRIIINIILVVVVLLLTLSVLGLANFGTMRI